MLLRDLAPGVHCVTDEVVNWYLVEDETGVLIVDAGLPPHWGDLCDALSELGRTRDEVRALIVTHAHADHVGFARRAQREWDLDVHIHPRDHGLSRHPAIYRFERSPLRHLRDPGFARVVAHFALKRAAFTVPVRDPLALPNGGATLNLPGRPVVIETPGHTAGHVSFHLPERDVLIAGDAIVTWDPYTGERGPRLISRAATADSAAARRSLDAIEATGAGVVLCGHGEPWTEGAARAVELARNAGQG